MASLARQTRSYPAAELPEPESPGCWQWCALAGAGAGDAEPADDGDELDDVVCATVVPVAAVPPVAARATPVAPAPTPAATMPVMSSLLARLPSPETIWFLPSSTAAAQRGWLVGEPDCAVGLAAARSGTLSALSVLRR